MSIQDNLSNFFNLLSQTGGKRKGGSDEEVIKKAIEYAYTLIGTPYRWYVKGPILGDDVFWAANDGKVDGEYIEKNNKSMVCTGLNNLMRRFVGTKIPGLEPLLINDEPGKPYSLRKEGLDFPGTTSTWHNYLRQKGWLEDINYENGEYPIGTMLIKSFDSLDGDQGHTAIIVGHGMTKKLKDCLLLHAYPSLGISFKDSKENQDVGYMGIQPYYNFHRFWDHPGRDTYFTHVSKAEHWLLDK